MLKFHSQEIFTVFPWFFLGIRQGCKISSSVLHCFAFCVILLLIFQSRRRLGFFLFFSTTIYLFTKL